MFGHPIGRGFSEVLVPLVTSQRDLKKNNFVIEFILLAKQREQIISE